MSIALQWIGVFLVMFVADLCWTFYIAKVQQGKAMLASFWSIALFLAGAAGTISYINNPWLLIPACIGVASGTYFAVVIEQHGKVSFVSKLQTLQEEIKAKIKTLEDTLG